MSREKRECFGKEVSNNFFPGGYLAQTRCLGRVREVAEEHEMGGLNNGFFGYGVQIVYKKSKFFSSRGEKGLVVRVFATSPESIMLAREVADEISERIKNPSLNNGRNFRESERTTRSRRYSKDPKDF